MRLSLRQMCLAVFVMMILIFAVPQAADADAKSKTMRHAVLKTVYVKLLCQRDDRVEALVNLLERQIEQRCPAKVESISQTEASIELALSAGIGAEGFRIEDGTGGAVRIVGNDQRGLLYGIGKFLRNSRYDQGGFTPGPWRGTSVPVCPLRAIYLATHYRNYYEAAPLQDVVEYVQDLGLWGYNSILIHYPTWQFKSLSDEPSQDWLKRFKTVLTQARACGLGVGLLQCPNAGFNPAPDDKIPFSTFNQSKWASTEVPGDLRGNFGIKLCISKPGAMQYLVDLHSRLLDEFSSVGLDLYGFWPYDEGGCACQDCWPWGSRGYLKISKTIRQAVSQRFPACQFILSTWGFENEDDANPDGEWVGLARAMSQDKCWVDYIMADGHEYYFPQYLLDQGVPGGLPLLNFPEISMFYQAPWGGYGANPFPAHLEALWQRIGHISRGGSPYSEGIYEDINKAIVASFYWDPNRKAEDAVRDYVAFEFAPDRTDELVELIHILEQNHKRNNIGPSAARAVTLAKKVDAHMTEQARQSWRWRIVYLRCLIDEGLRTGRSTIKEKEELISIYHAQKTDFRLKPNLRDGSIWW